ncbi:cystathionine beta-lyase [Ophiocordyceps camponoti-floridani]|uniref:Cystathionine beta-lyase n=1 Tax=Ophiocordyceps camponoti-floridani TaxID=2030778 RepID=A0A8H4Q6H8_9HYPO|nr:cystathionine beta-lyase [Ophiocordyceps camponoti-floridani]
MEKQQANAQVIAEFLESLGLRVRYPGLKSHPQYELHWSLARGAGAVLSFETGDAEISERIVEATRLWAISMPEDIIRLCVGIEDPNDLIQDLSYALVHSGAVDMKEVIAKLGNSVLCDD